MDNQSIATQKIKITGQVQGVGFRPFIYRLAMQHQLKGWVNNRSGEVIAMVQGYQSQLASFQQGILNQHPPLAIPEIASIETVNNETFNKFVIKKSAISEHAECHIPPDYFTCDDCLTELTDPNERRYRYPFINCTQCGPRYTIIRALPYDRPNTSMKDFPLCPDCNDEYTATLDRRFHAQPLACTECGPELSFYSEMDQNRVSGNEKALTAAIEALRQGKILAVKGIGGYHLMCDASNNEAVTRLRQRKHRPDKPLAVMFSHRGEDGLEQLRQYCMPTEAEAKVITSPQRPIVLLRSVKHSTAPPSVPLLKKGEAWSESSTPKGTTRQRGDRGGVTLAPAINPNLNEIGAMLAYSPLHYLILNDFGSPVVATSGNLSGEPVLTNNNEAEARINKVADAFLQHNRPILRPADDSVVRIIHQKKRLFRIGRGMAPLEIKLPFTLSKAVLATGGQMKNTIALAWANRAVISPHIGELDNKRSIKVFTQVIDDLCHLYRVKPEQIICDAHPDYYSSHYARNYAQTHQIELTTIQHHKAHAGIVYGEFDNRQNQNWLVFSWDGTGLGDDKSIWGGEAFYGQAGNWQRVASIKPFYLQGGDKAAREPWRSACALVWEVNQGDIEWHPADDDKTLLSHNAWKKRINTIQSSSMGRLFDAASAILSLGEESSFEGQGPMQLEALLAGPIKSTGQMSLPLYNRGELCLADWSDLLYLLLNDTQTQAQRSASFHECIAETLIAQAQTIRYKQGEFQVGLSGGVFQNKHLTEYVLQRLKEEGFNAFLPERVPYNDAGLAFGQIIEGSHYE